jgi:tetratricopeptide (TPR) repeat protein
MGNGVATTYEKGCKNLHDPNKYEKSILRFDKCLRMDPNFVLAYNSKATALHYLKRYEEALLCSNECLRVEPNNTSAHHLKGISLTHLKRDVEAIRAFDECLRVDPNYHLGHFDRGNVLNHLKRYEDAILSFDECLRLNPYDSHSHYSKGIALFSLERYEDALVCFNKCRERNYHSRFHDAQIHKGLTEAKINELQEFNRYELAFISLGQWPENAPTNKGDAFESLGSAMNNLMRYEEAHHWFENCLSEDPNRPSAHYGKGLALNRLERYRDAIASFELCLQINPTLVHAHFQKGIAHDGLMNSDNALLEYDQCLMLDPNFEDAHCRKRQTLSAMKKYEDLLISFETFCRFEMNENKDADDLWRHPEPKSRRSDPNIGRSLYLQGQELYKNEQYDEALRSLNECLSYYPEYDPAYKLKERTIHWIWYTRAGDLQHLNYYSTDCRRLNPKSISDQTGKELTLAELERYGKALLGFNHSLEKYRAYSHRNSDKIKAINDLGYALYDLKRYQEASDWFDLGLKIAPTLISVQVGKGLALNRLGFYQGALPYFHRSLMANPSHNPARNGCGYAYYGVKMYSDAVRCFQQCVQCVSSLNGHGLALNGLAEYKRTCSKQYEESLSCFEQALTCFEKSLKLEPDNVCAQNGKAVAEYELRRPLYQALLNAERRLRMDHNNVSALDDKGWILKKLHRDDEAILCHDRCLELDPNFYLGHFDRHNGTLSSGFNLIIGEEDFRALVVWFKQLDVAGTSHLSSSFNPFLISTPRRVKSC